MRRIEPIGRMALGIVLALCFAGVADAKEPKNSAREVVSEALDEVMAVLNQPGSTGERRDRISQIAYERFDFETMSKLVVAHPWKKFTKEQRVQFIAEFKTLLSRSYGRRLERYDNTVVEVVGEVAEPRGDMTIQSKIVGGQFDGATMDYRMRGRTGEWLVIDVIIEGISLVSNFRSQFKPILAEGGAAELLRRMTDKNSALQMEIAAEEGTPPAEPVSNTAQ